MMIILNREKNKEVGFHNDARNVALQLQDNGFWVKSWPLKARGRTEEEQALGFYTLLWLSNTTDGKGLACLTAVIFHNKIG